MHSGLARESEKVLHTLGQFDIPLPRDVLFPR